MSVDGTLSIRRRDLERESPVTARASVIEADGLTKSYGDARALDGLSLTVPHGTVLALLGPNGAGSGVIFSEGPSRCRPPRAVAHRAAARGA